MNPVVPVHLSAALVTILISVPLIWKKVKMNHWYGVRIPAAFGSQEAWFDINRFGGRLLLFYGFVIAATAMVGSLLDRQYWIPYDWTALVIIMGGLFIVVAMIYRYAQRWKSPNQPARQDDNVGRKA